MFKRVVRQEPIDEHGMSATGFIKTYAPYPAYRPSGVEWLPEIPAHWDLKRLRVTVLGSQNGVWGTEPTGNDDIACVRVADFDRVRFRANMENPTFRSIEVADIHARGLHPGDLLLEVSGGGEKQPVGALVLYEDEQQAVCSNFVARLRPLDGFEPRYLTYLHATLYSLRVNVRSIKQSIGIQNLDKASYLNEVAGIPPLPEQRAIAGFLDRETAKIDSLIAKKERLIELLQEKRTALISRAVTRGLDPNVPMKHSGVEWLGRIPAHWGVRKLKTMVPNITVGIVVTPAKYYVDQGVPCLRSLNIAHGRISTHDLVFISHEANLLHKKSQIFRGDVVVVRTGRAGVAVVVPDELDGANCIDLLIVRRSEHLYPRFFYYMMNSRMVAVQVSLDSVGAIQEHYNTATLANLMVPRIPLMEQHMIAGFLDRETAKIDALVTKVAEAIKHLNELRSALISAAVTGKIDVREHAA